MARHGDSFDKILYNKLTIIYDKISYSPKHWTRGRGGLFKVFVKETGRLKAKFGRVEKSLTKLLSWRIFPQN